MGIHIFEVEYRNFGRCICLENGTIQLIASLEFGPRILSFKTRGCRNILFEDISRDFCELNKGYGTWYAYGGHRLWTAPELMPETYFPDNSRITCESSGDSVTLTARPTPFGKQFSLCITMSDAGSVRIRNTVQNLSDAASVFAPWSITSLTTGGLEFVPLSQEQTGFLPNRTMALWSYSNIADERFRLTDACAVLRQDPEAAGPFKAGFNVRDGYAVYAAGNQIFRKKFGGYEKCSYPDFGCNFETYTNKHFIECEILGEMRAYAPGESAVIKETWEICETDRTPEDVIAELISAHDKI